EDRAGRLVQPNLRSEGSSVGAAVYGRFGPDHTDDAGSSGSRRGPRARVDHAYHGNLGPNRDVPYRGDLHGVAGDDQDLHISRDQVARDLKGEGSDLVERAVAVREPRGVADVYQ